MAKSTFTSESVCAGHPDKICDQISDAILDAVLAQDPNGHVAIESLATENRLILAGEVNTTATVDFEQIARQQIKRLGYTDPKFNFTDQCTVENCIHRQSPEIAIGVDADGAGDQGMMFGYACRETDRLMPLPITLGHQLAQQIDTVRQNSTLNYLRPDGKTQVTIQYQNGKPIAVESIVLAVPHSEDTGHDQLQADLKTHVIEPVLTNYKLKTANYKLVINGTGIWYIGGPYSDAGLTGRKIIVDTYGGYARVGGGAFSGKDPSKVDRSGAYAARFIAKNIVAHNLADQAEVRLAYVIGRPYPLMQQIETFGTAKVSDRAINDFAAQLIDTSVKGIIERLNLRRPIYFQTAAYGHFGKEGLPWEEIVEI